MDRLEASLEHGHEWPNLNIESQPISNPNFLQQSHFWHMVSQDECVPLQRPSSISCYCYYHIACLHSKHTCCRTLVTDLLSSHDAVLFSLVHSCLLFQCYRIFSLLFWRTRKENIFVQVSRSERPLTPTRGTITCGPSSATRMDTWAHSFSRIDIRQGSSLSVLV